MRKFQRLLLVLVLLLSMCMTAAAAEREKVILDTDMVDWFDDGMAMMMLATSPKIDLLGVTVVLGNTWVQTGTASAIRQLEAIDRTDIPVAMGVNTTIRENRRDTIYNERKLFGRGEDQHMGEFGYPEPKSWQDDYWVRYRERPKHEPIKEHAVDFLIRNVKDNPNQVTLVVIGGCGNVAAAYQKAPEIAGLLKKVVYMGGAFFQGGNVMPSAEFNFWIDPEAAAIALKMPVKQVIFPLDVCEDNHITKAHYNELRRVVKDPVIHKLIDDHWMTPLLVNGTPFNNYIWDVLTVAYVMNPEIVTKQVTYPVAVNDYYSPSYGSSMAYKGVGPEGSQKADIVLEINDDMLWDMIYEASAKF